MKKKILLKNSGGYTSLLNNERTTLIADEPERLGGKDYGFSPDELVIAGLAACKAATLRGYALKQGYALEDVNVEVNFEVGKGEARSLSTSIDVKVELIGKLSEEEKKALLTKADTCFVHRMLQGNFEIGEAVEVQSE